MAITIASDKFEQPPLPGFLLFFFIGTMLL